MLPSFDIHSDKSEFLFVTDLILTMSLRRLSLASGIEKKRIPPSNTGLVCTVNAPNNASYLDDRYLRGSFVRLKTPKHVVLYLRIYVLICPPQARKDMQNTSSFKEEKIIRF